MNRASDTIDCRGLSTALIILRIKQAMVGRGPEGGSLKAFVGADCDCNQAAAALEDGRHDVALVQDELNSSPVDALHASHNAAGRANV